VYLQIFAEPIAEDAQPVRVAKIEEKAKAGKLYMPEPLSKANRPPPPR